MSLKFLLRRGLWISWLWHVSFTIPAFQTLVSVPVLIVRSRGGSALCLGCLQENDWDWSLFWFCLSLNLKVASVLGEHSTLERVIYSPMLGGCCSDLLSPVNRIWVFFFFIYNADTLPEQTQHCCFTRMEFTGTYTHQLFKSMSARCHRNQVKSENLRHPSRYCISKSSTTLCLI